MNQYSLCQKMKEFSSYFLNIQHTFLRITNMCALGMNEAEESDCS